MKLYRVGGILLACFVASSSFGQNTNLTRAEGAAIKAKLVAVQKAMGGDPEGYVKESEDFYLPTEFNPASDGKYWPISSSVSMRFTDRAVKEGTANAEQASKDLEARYAAALASGDPNAIAKMTQEVTKLSQLAVAASLSSEAKEDMSVDVQFNSSPYSGIDPDAVVFESPGVIALRDLSQGNRVTVYLDPVALAETETLSSLRLQTPQDGVGNRTGVYNVTITLTGTGEDIEAWAQSFDRDAMLAVIDPQ